MTGAAPLVLFAPASGAEAGGGHVMRCLALAAALRARGARCQFACEPYGLDLTLRFGDGLEPGLQLRAPLSQAPEALAACARDMMVLDDYRLDAPLETQLRGDARRLLVIDDLANRSHAADLILDPGYGRTPKDYAPRLARPAEVLAGPAYALLRPAFSALRAASLKRRSGDAAGRPLERLFMSFGLSDVDAAAWRAYRRVREIDPDVEIDLALGRRADSLSPLKGAARRDARLRLHVETTETAALIAGADAAVGAGGSSTWERACLGAPSLALIVADNQRETTWRLDAAGALIAVEAIDATFVAAYRRLQDPRAREGLSAAAAALCDGRGAARAAERLLSV